VKSEHPKIAFLDLEGTLLKKNTHFDDGKVAPSVWTVLADKLGPAALSEEIGTKDKWNAGKYPSYIAWMKDTVEIHKRYGLTEKVFRKAIADVEFTDGTDELFDYFKQHQIVTCIITGGFKELAERVVTRYQIDHAISACEYYFAEGKLDHAIYFPSDYFGKVDFMKIIMREYAQTPYDCIFIGDGKNDADLARHVATSFAFNAQSELKAVATESIDQAQGGENLAAILRLLNEPTQRMRAAHETRGPAKILGRPKYINDETFIQLWKEAMWARKASYAPYSKFRVGAALLGGDNQIFSGTNFENAAYGSTICAERSAVAKMIAARQRKLKAIAIVSDDPNPIPPCGDCLQVLSEFARETDILLCSSSGTIECQTIDSLLPRRFNLSGEG
jgi:phosphoserine phosphatase